MTIFSRFERAQFPMEEEDFVLENSPYCNNLHYEIVRVAINLCPLKNLLFRLRYDSSGSSLFLIEVLYMIEITQCLGLHFHLALTWLEYIL